MSNALEEGQARRQCLNVHMDRSVYFPANGGMYSQRRLNLDDRARSRPILWSKALPRCSSIAMLCLHRCLSFSAARSGMTSLAARPRTLSASTAPGPCSVDLIGDGVEVTRTVEGVLEHLAVVVFGLALLSSRCNRCSRLCGSSVRGRRGIGTGCVAHMGVLASPDYGVRSISLPWLGRPHAQFEANRTTSQLEMSCSQPYQAVVLP